MTDKNGNNQLMEQDPHHQMPEREEEAQLGLSMLAKLALITVVVVSIIISVTMVMQYNRLEEEKKELEALIEKNNADISELQYWRDHPINDEYIEKFAKENGLDYADAKLFLEIIHGMKD